MILKPLITVLMPVYNGEKYLGEAIDSILNQSYTNFEFIIINDGSTDKTEEIILAYKDERVRYIKNEKNLRLIASLNKGLDLATGKYIARMDADDISHPLRLEKQVLFMEQREDVGLLGTYYSSFNENDNNIAHVKMPFTDHEGLTFRLLFSSTIRHPTALIRTQILRDNAIYFNKDFLHAEEHQFWLEIVKHAKVAVYPEMLLKVRLHEESVTGNNEAKKIQAETECNIRKEQLAELVQQISDEEQKIICSFLEFFRYTRNPYIEQKKHYTKDELEILYALVQKICKANRVNYKWNNKILEPMFYGKLSDILLLHSHIGLSNFLNLLKLQVDYKLSIPVLAKAFVKSLFKIKRTFTSLSYNNYLK